MTFKYQLNHAKAAHPQPFYFHNSFLDQGWFQHHISKPVRMRKSGIFPGLPVRSLSLDRLYI